MTTFFNTLKSIPPLVLRAIAVRASNAKPCTRCIKKKVSFHY